MGNKSSAEKLKSKKVSMKLDKFKKVEEGQLKLLLLGAGESGKSTIFKQMKLLYGEGFTEEERFKMRPFLIANLVEGAQDIFEAAKVVGITLNDECNEAGRLLADVEDRRVITDEIVAAINLLWNNEDFRKIYDKRSKFQLQDTWAEFADKLADYPRWGGNSWVPTADEILRARIRTTGIVDEEFTFNGVKLRMLDVGGQRNERKKWMHCFESVTSLLFVASLSEYDQTLFEDNSENRLVESLSLFEEVANSKWFVDSALILFLNKSDLFQEKYVKKKIPLNVSGKFPTAPKGKNVEEAYEWFESMFKSKLKPLVGDKKKSGKKKTKPVYVHVTCATDTESISAIMTACSQHILRQNLEGSGVLG